MRTVAFALFVFLLCPPVQGGFFPSSVEVTIIGPNAPEGAKGKFHIKQTPTMTELYYFLNTMNAFTGGSEDIHVYRNSGTDKKTCILRLLKLIKDGKGKTTFEFKDGDVIAIPAY